MSHIHEKIDFTVGVFVVYKDKVLLRLHEKYTLWLPVGGHIELHEDPIEAALREVKEEVGLDVKLWNGNQKIKYENGGPPYYDYEIIPPVGMNRHTLGPNGHQHIDLRYFAISETDHVTPENADDKWEWLGKNELHKVPMLAYIREYAALALDTLGEK